MNTYQQRQQRTYYDVLDVGRAAGKGEIKRAFRRLAKRYHPDTNLQDEQGAAKRLKEVIKAYRVLSNDRERARYDVGLDTGRVSVLPDREFHRMSISERCRQILDELLKGDGQEALAEYEELRKAEKGFDLSRYLSTCDYLDCIFLLAEQYECAGRYHEAAVFYEELYRREKNPPRHRFFFTEVEERIKKLYTRRLPREAENPEKEIECYERILSFDIDRSERAFILKKIAEVHCTTGNLPEARKIFGEALDLKPGLKGTATIREKLGM